MNIDAIVAQLHSEMAHSPDLALDPAQLARRIRSEAGVISDFDVIEVLRRLRNDTAGLGLLEHVLSRPGVTDVVVNGPKSVFVDCGQGLEPAAVGFHDDAEVRRLATRLAITSGQRLDDAQPFADGRITREDGSTLRIHCLLAPPSASGTCISVRVLRQAQTSLQGLTDNRTVPPDIANLLADLIKARLSFLVIGGTGSGKTTLLSALLGEIPGTERIVIIEDTAELRPNHCHFVTLVSRRANAEGSGEVTMAQLLRQSLRMRPDRIVVGEIRGGEVVDLLAALNTGHDGGAGTLHANSLAEVPARIEALAALGGLDRQGTHSQLAAAVDVVLTMQRTRKGRRLMQIGLLTGNPVTCKVVWTAQDGALDGFAQLRETIRRRLGRETNAGEEVTSYE